jgi:hypothetical protein
MNFEILTNAPRALKDGGKLIMTTLNGLYPLRHSIKDFTNENQDNFSVVRNKFNPQTMRDVSTVKVEDDSGNIKEITTNEKYYLPDEIEKLLRSLNYTSVAIYGCECGNFIRGRQPTADDYEMLVIADK